MRLCSRSKRATKDLAAPAVAGVWGIPYCRELIESLFWNVLDHADLLTINANFIGSLDLALVDSQWFSEKKGAGKPRDT